MTSRKTALVVCPGRGTYNKPELGYLNQHHSGRAPVLSAFEAIRKEAGQPSLASLDQADTYRVATHTRGDNASLLIHACAYCDFLDIDRAAYDIVAVTGNSMGWYTALACAEAVSMEAGARIVNTMGTFMHEHPVGGQIVYPLVGDDWTQIAGRRAELMSLLETVNEASGHQAYISIELGGMLVLAGNDAGLNALQEALPVIDRFPMILSNHSAFHTELQRTNSDRGLSALGADLFTRPALPLIDGRGSIWHGASTAPADLHRYTLDHQVTQMYDFTSAIRVGVHEFAPDCVIVLGPGTTLGGAVAQSLIDIKWRGWATKTEFTRDQSKTPHLISMGRADQRMLATKV